MSKDQHEDDDNFAREDPLDDGYEVEQCPIRFNHPEHLWGKPGEVEKMCEGL